MRTTRSLVAGLVLCAAVGALAGPAGAVKLAGSVMGQGGRPVSGSGRVVNGTVGQAIVGRSGGTRVAYHGFWWAGGVHTVGVEEGPGGPGRTLPSALAFGAPRPNPSRAGVRFSVALPRAASVSLAVVDLQGRRVAGFPADSRPAGDWEVSWDGRDDSGQSVAAGVYFARLDVDGRPFATRRVIRLP